MYGAKDPLYDYLDSNDEVIEYDKRSGSNQDVDQNALNSFNAITSLLEQANGHQHGYKGLRTNGYVTYEKRHQIANPILNLYQ